MFLKKIKATFGNSKKKDELLIRKGPYAKQLKLMQRVETFTLSHGWKDDKIARFRKAIEEVVLENPILTSHLVWKKNSIYTSLGTFTIENHSFCTVEYDRDLDVRKTFCNQKATMKYMHGKLAKKIECQNKTASEDIETKRPLFHAHLFVFSHDYACLYIGVSHAIVDVATYYNIVGQISALMNDQDITPINWQNEHMITLEPFPDHYTFRDRRKGGLLPMLFGALVNISRTRREQAWIVRKDKVIFEKRNQLDTNLTNYLESDDIILSKVSELLQSSVEINIDMDYRDKSPEFARTDGGNCSKAFNLPSNVASNPNLLRQTIDKGYYYEANQVDGKPLKKGQLCYSSSWINSYKQIEGMKTLCHTPSFNLIQGQPFDVCIMFVIDESHFAVFHNFLEYDKAKLKRMKWVRVCRL
ncbi:hypothetical protein CTEN210_01643 [Chaetoceros tenuissimus]|uniref:Uncharacterized protein n=1 Tax=Chaetoceros tenuissimus TaxID=426638 RepID=A0AAD3H097_9STRA|nr:hypothetical protein CTEN210_01643 [Chaetoceros tenuissimus]